jgi:hypothetical protein
MIPYYIPAGVSRAELVGRDVGGWELNTHDLGSSSLRWRKVYGVNGDFSTLTVSGLTQGSVIFAGADGSLSQDNANFFWDDANNRLGIGTNTPATTLHVAGTVELPNIPTAAATDEVLRINTATGEVRRSTAAAVISAAGIIRGSYSIQVPPGGDSFTISVPGDILPGAIVTVTLVGPGGGTIYSLMVTNVDDINDEITVVSSGTISVSGYAIHYIIINP